MHIIISSNHLIQKSSLKAAMNTRSKTRTSLPPPLAPLATLAPLYSNIIDFDDASSEWNRNKKRIGQMYAYVCGTTTVSGKPCQRRPINDGHQCAQHHKKTAETI